jgi:archaemetzincin
VKLVILGRFPAQLTDAVEQGLREELQVDVERIDDLPLPREAYYPPRRRYRADRLLDILERHLEGAPASTRVLGMTAVDISITNPPHRDWGVFGLGQIGGRACVISTFRLRRRARNAGHRRFRVVTTAIHEVGHTLGLRHCTEPRCIMRDAEGSIQTVDDGDGHLGPGCRRALDRLEPRRLPTGG